MGRGRYPGREAASPGRGRNRRGNPIPRPGESLDTIAGWLKFPHHHGPRRRHSPRSGALLACRTCPILPIFRGGPLPSVKMAGSPWLTGGRRWLGPGGRQSPASPPRPGSPKFRRHSATRRFAPASCSNRSFAPNVLHYFVVHPQGKPGGGQWRHRQKPRETSPVLASSRSFIGFDGWSLPPPPEEVAPPQKKQNAPLFPTPPTCRFPPSDFPLPPPVQGKIRGTRLSYGIFMPSPPLPPGNPLVRPCPASTPTWKASPGKRSWN